ncbi:MAG: 4-hydroxy-tetrahydrodipicolinate synthase [Gammaproteobacteria bacterium]|nr:4-hydroxy-tetrahydrodipicolinate synthase [Gammaproteobacteria bacterium]
MFKGSLVALVTPMFDDETIDIEALKALVEWHIESGTDAIVATGTTGESATLDSDEHFFIIETVVKQVAGRVPVIAGSGSNATKSTINLTQNAKRAGADACLVVTPYYNKPTQNGLVNHYKSIALAVDIPLILYNVPGRTACDILPETVAKLAQIKNIIGIKEATGIVERASEIRRACGQNFYIWSGDDATALALMQQGANGVISVTANIAPEKMHLLCKAALVGDHPTARSLNDRLMGLHQHLFDESNPIPTKWALNQMGKIKSGIRLPLLKLDPKYQPNVMQAMHRAGVEIEAGVEVHS